MCISIRDWSLITGGRGYKKGGGADNAEGGAQKVWGRFYVVA